MDGKVFTYIFGLTNIFIGTFLIYNLLKAGQQSGTTWIKKRGIAIPLAFVLFLNGGYGLYNPDSGRYNIGRHTWTSDDRQMLIGKCLQETSVMAQKHPQIMKDYCECGVDRTMKALSYEEYIQSLNKSDKDRIKEGMPIIKYCYNLMKRRIA